MRNRFSTRVLLAAALAGATLFGAPKAKAVDYVMDANKTTNTIWQWGVAGNWVPNGVPNASTDNARVNFFRSGSGEAGVTVNLGGNTYTVGSLTVTEGNGTIPGTFANGTLLTSLIDYLTGGNAAITFAADLTVNSGGTALVLRNNANNLVFNGSVLGTSGTILQGSGLTQFTAATYGVTGGLTFAGNRSGETVFALVGGTNKDIDTLTVIGSGKLTVDRVSGAGNTSVTVTGATNVLANRLYVRGADGAQTIVNLNALNFNSPAPNSEINVENGGTLNLNGAVTIGSGLGITRTNNGVLNLNTSNARTGTTTLTNGTTNYQAVDALGTGAVVVSGGTANFNTTQNISSLNQTGGTVNFSGGATLGTAGISIAGGTFNLSTTGIVGSGLGVINSLTGGTLNVTGDGSLGQALSVGTGAALKFNTVQGAATWASGTGPLAITLASGSVLIGNMTNAVYGTDIILPGAGAVLALTGNAPDTNQTGGAVHTLGVTANNQVASVGDDGNALTLTDIYDRVEINSLYTPSGNFTGNITDASGTGINLTVKGGNKVFDNATFTTAALNVAIDGTSSMTIANKIQGTNVINIAGTAASQNTNVLTFNNAGSQTATQTYNITNGRVDTNNAGAIAAGGIMNIGTGAAMFLDQDLTSGTVNVNSGGAIYVNGAGRLNAAGFTVNMNAGGMLWLDADLTGTANAKLTTAIKAADIIVFDDGGADDFDSNLQGLKNGVRLTTSAGQSAQLNAGNGPTLVGGATDVSITAAATRVFTINDVVNFGSATVSLGAAAPVEFLAGGGSNTRSVAAATGTVRLRNASFTSGNINVESGTLLLDGSTANPNMFGATTVLTVKNGATLTLNNNNQINDTASLVVDGTFNVNNKIEVIGSLAGSGLLLTGTTNTNPLTFGGNNANTTYSGGFTVNGNGTSTLIKTGTGIMTLDGAVSFNPDSNDTINFTVADGVLVLNKTGGDLFKSRANLIIGDGTGVSTDIARLGGNEQIANDQVLNVAASGKFELNNFTETVAGITGAVGSVIDTGTTGTLIVSSNSGSHTHAGAIQGTSGVTLTGTNTTAGNYGHTQILSGVSTFLGDVQLLGGTLGVGNSAALGAGTNAVAMGTNLNNNNVRFVLTADGINVARDVNVADGAGSRSLGGTNTTGTSTLTGDVNMAKSLQLFHDNVNGTFVLDGSITGTGNLTKGGVGKVVVNGPINVTGSLSVTGGTLDLNNQNYTANGTLTMGGDTYTNTNPALETNADVVLTMGTGTLTLGGNLYYYTGPASSALPAFNSGVAVINGNVDLGGASRSVRTDNSSRTERELTINGAVNGLGLSLRKVGTGTLVINGDSTGASGIDGNIVVEQGTLELGSLAQLKVGASAVGNVSTNPTGSNPTIRVAANANVPVNTIDIKDARFALQADLNPVSFLTLTSTGGALLLHEVSNFSAGGQNVLNFSGSGANALPLGANWRLGASTNTDVVNPDVDSSTAASLVFVPATGNFIHLGGGNAALILNNAITGSAIADIDVSGTIVYNTTNTHSGGNRIGQNFAGGTLRLDNVNGLGSGATTVYSGGTLNVNVADADLSGVVVNSGGLLRISQTQNLVGGAPASIAGIVELNTATAADTQFDGASFATGSVMRSLMKGTANVGNLPAEDGSLLPSAISASTWNGDITLAGALTVEASSILQSSTDRRARNFTLAGDISGAGSLVKTGDSVVILSGNNSYLGGTTVNAGRLRLDTVTALGTGATVVNNGGILDANAAVIDLSNVTVNAGGALRLSNVQGSAPTNPIAGRIDINYALAIGSSFDLTMADGSSMRGMLAGEFDGDLDVNGTVSFDTGNTGVANRAGFKVSGDITGTGGITKIGTNVNNVLVFTGTNTYAGATVINGGVLALQSEFTAEGTILNTSSITINNGGTLLINNDRDFSLADRVNSTVNITSGGEVSFLGTLAGSSEVIPTVNLAAGQANLTVSYHTPGTVTGVNHLDVTSLTRAPSGTINFRAGNGTLGVAGLESPRIVLGGVADGFIGAYARVNDNWAKYNSALDNGVALGVTSFVTADYDVDNNDATWNSSSHVKMDNNVTMVGDRTIKTLNINTTSGNRILTLGGFTLNVASGGVIMTSSNRNHQIHNGNLTAGGASDAELIVYSGDLVGTGVRTNTIGANIIDNPLGGVVTFVKAGRGNLRLSGTNAYTGDTYINEGNLSVNGQAVTSGDYNVRTGGSLSVVNSGTWANTFNVDFGGTATFTGPTVLTGTLNGAGNISGGSGLNNALLISGTYNLTGDLVDSNVAAPGNTRFDVNDAKTTGIHFTTDAVIASSTTLRGNDAVNSDPTFGVRNGATVTFNGFWQGNGGNTDSQLVLIEGGKFLATTQARFNFFRDLAGNSAPFRIHGDGTGILEFADGFVASPVLGQGVANLRLGNVTLVTHSDSSRPGAFIFDITDGARWRVQTNDQTFNGTFGVQNSVTLDTDTADLTLNGSIAISAGKTLTHEGPGTLTMAFDNNVLDGTFINTEGTVSITGNTRITTGNNYNQTGGSTEVFGNLLVDGNYTDAADSTLIRTGGTVAVAGTYTGLIQIDGGVFAGNGVLSRNLGTGSSDIRFTGANGGGFAGYGGLLTVNIGGGGTLTWDTTNFIATGGALLFGSERADSSVLMANNLDLGSGQTRVLSVADGDALNDATIAGDIIGNSNLRKTGAGTITLSGNNTFGTTSANFLAIEGGKVAATDNSNLGNANTTLNLIGGTLQANADFALEAGLGQERTVNIDGTLGGGIEVTDAFLLTLSGQLNYNGGTLTKTGTGTLEITGLQVAPAGSTLQAQAGTVDIYSSIGTLLNLKVVGSTVNLNVTGPQTLASLEIGGAGVLNNNDLLATAGTFTTSGSGGTLNLGTGSNVTISGSGNTNWGGNLVVSGDSDLILNRTGGTVVVAPVGGAKITIQDPAGLVVLAGGIDPFTDSVTSTRHVDVVNNSASTVDLNRDVAIGTLGGTNAAAILNLLGGGTRVLTMESGSSDDYAGQIVQAVGTTGELVKRGAGTQGLSGTNSYTGPTTVYGGALRATFGTGLPATTVLNLRGGVLEAEGTYLTNLNLGTANGQVNIGAGGGGFSAHNGVNTVNLNGGTATLAWDDAFFVPTGSALLLGSLTANDVTDFQNGLDLGNVGATREIGVRDNAASATDIGRISGLIQGSNASLLKTGAGVLELTNAGNSYSGSTTITGGSLQLGANDVLPDSTDVIINTTSGTASLLGNGYNDTINSLTLGGAKDTSAVVDTGAGTLTVNGAITYLAANNPAPATLKGTIALSAGDHALAVGDSISLNTAVPPVDTRTVELTINSKLTGAGGFTKSGAGTIVINPLDALNVPVANDFAGQVNINEGGVRLGYALPNIEANHNVLVDINALSDGSAVVFDPTNTINVELLIGMRETLGSIAGGGSNTRILLPSRNQSNPTITNITHLRVGADNTDTTFNGVLDSTGTGQSIATRALFEKVGDGRLILTNTNTFTGTVRISGTNGNSRLTSAQLIAVAGDPGTEARDADMRDAALQFAGGVLEVDTTAGEVTFNRNEAGTGLDRNEFGWTGTQGGGFAATGGNALLIKIGNGTGTLSWNAIGSGPLVFGSVSSDSLVDWQNGIDLAAPAVIPAADRVVWVNDNTNVTTDIAQIRGNIGGGSLANLVKDGAGTLVLRSTNSSYTGQTIVRNGVLEVWTVSASGSNSSVGNTSSAIVLGDATNLTSGTFRFLGNSEDPSDVVDTNRGFTLAYNGTIDLGYDEAFQPLAYTSRGTFTFGANTLTKTGDGTLNIGRKGDPFNLPTPIAPVAAAIVADPGAVLSVAGGTVNIISGGDADLTVNVSTTANFGYTGTTALAGLVMNAGSNVTAGSDSANETDTVIDTAALSVTGAGAFLNLNAGPGLTNVVNVTASMNLDAAADLNIAGTGGRLNVAAATQTYGVGSALNINSSTVAFTTATSGGADLLVNSLGGTLELNNTDLTAGAGLNLAGTVKGVGTASTSASTTVNINGSAMAEVGLGDTLALNGDLSNEGNILNKIGDGTLVINGNQTNVSLASNTSVQAGTALINSAAGAAGMNIDVQGTGIAKFGSNNAIATLSGNFGSVDTNGNTVTVANLQQLTTDLNKIGNGSLAINGIDAGTAYAQFNTLAGTTEVNADSALRLALTSTGAGQTNLNTAQDLPEVALLTGGTINAVTGNAVAGTLRVDTTGTLNANANQITINGLIDRYGGPGAIAFTGPGATLNIASTGAGAVNLNLNSAGSPTVTMDPAGAVVNISAGSTLNAGGDVDPFTDTANMVSASIGNSGTFNVTAGTKTVNQIVGANITPITYAGTTNVAADAVLNASVIRQANLNLQGNIAQTTGRTTVVNSTPLDPLNTGTDAAISRVNTITIANDGAGLGLNQYFASLDLTNNDLLIDYTGATPLADITDMLRGGYNTFGWDGVGITSSTAQSDPLKWTLAIVDNADLIAFGFGYGDGVSDFNGDMIPEPLYHGQAVDADTIFVKFTYQGDADLDGLLTGFDYFLIDTFAGGVGSWFMGDFNYDGLTGDGFDYFLLDNNFTGDALTQALPEPSTFGLLALGALGMLRRRRRQA